MSVTTWKLNPVSKNIPFYLGEQNAKASMKQYSFYFSLWNSATVNPYPSHPESELGGKKCLEREPVFPKEK